ncbi:hypothetical protein [Spirosoma terrae]
MRSVFVSRPNWIPVTFQAGVDNFYNLLESNSLSTRTIGVSDYPNESPLDEVIKLMKQCEGTIILGIPQIEITSGKIKDTEIKPIQRLGTEWNHIEGALAHSLNHPMLVIHHLEVKRGIFDRGACNAFLHSVDMSDPSWVISKPISGALTNWKNKLVKVDKQTPSNETSSIPKPTLQWGMYKFEGEAGLYCPVCFEKQGLKIPCSRINSSHYQCPNCNAKLS